jgi:hypothetical protein
MIAQYMVPDNRHGGSGVRPGTVRGAHTDATLPLCSGGGTANSLLIFPS